MIDHRKPCLTGLLLAALAVASAPGHASILGKRKTKDDLSARKLTPAQSQLVDRAIAREAATIKVIKERQPLVETYIQRMKPDPVMLQVPLSDQHFLGRVDFRKALEDETYETKDPHKDNGRLGFLKNGFGYLGSLNKQFRMQFNENGFTRMIFVDAVGFNRQNYNFAYVRNDFLGSVPTTVFDVEPVKGRPGQFYGRIWVERRNGNIVRYNGSLAGSEKDYKEYYHFDSWRTNIQESLWLPTSFYVEESDPKSPESTLQFKAINYVWGYALKTPPSDAENVDVQVQGATDVSQEAQDVNPLGAQREWVQQAEDNVVNRLFQAGLLDAPSDFDKIMEQIAGNILAYNNIQVARPIRVRTLLTEPLESLAIGNTIVISKSLIDTTAVPGNNNEQVNNLYAVIAFQVAHIIQGHRLDTKYAFNDRLLFPDNRAFEKIPMHHTDRDNEEAAKKTLELLQPAELQPAAGQFGLYLAQLKERSRALTALNEPMIGDSLVRDQKLNTFWLEPLIGKGPKLNVNDLKQTAAMPLASFLKFDPWTDQVVQMHYAAEPLLSARDKMPFEVTPVYLKLQYYKGPELSPAAAQNAGTVGAAAGTDANGAPTAGTASPDANAPQATVPTDNTNPAPQNSAPETTPAAPNSGTSNPPPAPPQR